MDQKLSQIKHESQSPIDPEIGRRSLVPTGDVPTSLGKCSLAQRLYHDVVTSVEFLGGDSWIPAQRNPSLEILGGKFCKFVRL